MKILYHSYDAHTNKTHVRVETSEFTEWYWVSGEVKAANALEILYPVICDRLHEFRLGEVDTPHEIQANHCGLL